MPERVTHARDIPVVAPPDWSPRAATFVVPPGACDCHAHVCGPATRYPCAPERIYTPVDATFADYRQLLAVMGIQRGVLVQPSFYGRDNAALLDALAEGGADHWRGVVVVPDDVAELELRRMHELGVRGARFNIVDTATDKGVLPLPRLRRFAERVRDLGWHLELLLHVEEFPDLADQFRDFPVPIVVGHLGYVRPPQGPSTPGFQGLLRLMRDGIAWVKLTGPYRISRGDLPYVEADSFAMELLAAAPGRLLWGSDWPHVKAAWSTPMPNDGDLLDLLARWVPDADMRRRILVENPAALYGFTQT